MNMMTSLSLPYDGGTYGPFHTYEVDRVGDTVPSRTEAFVDHHPALKALLQGEASPLRAVVAHIAGRRAIHVGIELHQELVDHARQKLDHRSCIGEPAPFHRIDHGAISGT